MTVPLILYALMWLGLAVQWNVVVPTRQKVFFDYGLQLPVITTTVFRLHNILDVWNILVLIGLMLPGVAVMVMYPPRPGSVRFWYWLRNGLILLIPTIFNGLVLLSWWLPTIKLREALNY